ncbi:MAG: EscU/YscU/HrcU family type III secretion system export apparatus switch protein [Halopseudomonas aestusnigri]
MSESGEKTEEPTEQRLTDSRNKGQVPQSKQVSAIFVVTAGVVLCFAIWNSLARQINDLMLYSSGSAGRPFPEFISVVYEMVLSLALGTIIPVFGMLSVVMVLGKFVCSGFSFSLEPMAPKFAKFNVVNNLKNIFGISSLYNLAFMLLITLFSLIVGWAVFIDKQRDLTYSVYCGLPCSTAVIAEILFLILAPVVGLLFLWSFIEILVQKAFFRKNLKMTKDEIKRESKESFGDPEIMGARKQLGREIATGARFIDTTFVIIGKEIALGFQYHPRSIPTPVLLFKFRGEGAQSLIRIAKKNKIPIVYKSRLANLLGKSQPVGDMLKKEFFSPFVDIIKELGLDSS